MARRLFAVSVSAGLLAVLACGTSVQAQAVVPPRPPVPQLDPFQQIQQIQQEIEQLQQALLNRREAQNIGGQLRWGGLRLKKVTPALQEKLGLPENEGLLVMAVDANTPADKAGLKANDILVKIGNKAIPSESSTFAKLVKEQQAGEPMDLVVVRDGKEMTLKGAAMPVVVQASLDGAPGGRGGAGIGGLGGAPGRPGLPGIGGLIIPRINVNPRPIVPNFPNPFQPPTPIKNLRMEMTVDGVKISRKQTNDQFSGEYAKDELKIIIAGKLQNGQPTVSEVTVQEGKETKKYTKLTDVPVPHRATIQQHLLPTSGNPLPLFQGLPMIPDVLPVIPGLDN